jgi:NADP-dependent 3-hydroxy acid dehydrogenase YdfG
MSPSEETRRVALITGCSEPQSLGVATVRQLQKRGWRVIATARKAESMRALQEDGVDVSALCIRLAQLSEGSKAHACRPYHSISSRNHLSMKPSRR